MGKPVPFEMETAKDIFVALIKNYGKPKTDDIFVYLAHSDKAYANKVNKKKCNLHKQLSALRSVRAAKSSTKNTADLLQVNMSPNTSPLANILLKIIINL